MHGSHNGAAHPNQQPAVVLRPNGDNVVAVVPIEPTKDYWLNCKLRCRRHPTVRNNCCDGNTRTDTDRDGAVADDDADDDGVMNCRSRSFDSTKKCEMFPVSFCCAMLELK